MWKFEQWTLQNCQSLKLRCEATQNWAKLQKLFTPALHWLGLIGIVVANTFPKRFSDQTTLFQKDYWTKQYFSKKINLDQGPISIYLSTPTTPVLTLRPWLGHQSSLKSWKIAEQILRWVSPSNLTPIWTAKKDGEKTVAAEKYCYWELLNKK